MLNLFRTNQIAFNLLLIVYVFVIRGAAFFVTYPPASFAGQGVLSDSVYSRIGAEGFLPTLIGIGLVFLQALIINVIVAKFRMATTISLLPGLFYALFASLFPEFLRLSPVLMANTFFLLALWELYETYRKNQVAGHIINVGFWIGLGSLFYFSEVIFLLMGILGLNALRALRPKEILMLFIGFGIPYVIASAYFFWYDQLGDFWQTYLVERFSFMDFAFEWGLASWTKLGITAFFVFVVLLSFDSYFSKKGIQAQKNITVLYWALFFAFLSLLFQKEVYLYHLLIFMVPIGILISFNFLKLSPRIAEALHLLLFAGVLIWQFYPLWMS